MCALISSLPLKPHTHLEHVMGTWCSPPTDFMIAELCAPFGNVSRFLIILSKNWLHALSSCSKLWITHPVPTLGLGSPEPLHHFCCYPQGSPAMDFLLSLILEKHRFWKTLQADVVFFKTRKKISNNSSGHQAREAWSSGLFWPRSCYQVRPESSSWSCCESNWSGCGRSLNVSR